MEIATLLHDPYLYTGLSTVVTTAVIIYKGGPALKEIATSYYNSIVKSFKDLQDLEDTATNTVAIGATRAEKLNQDMLNARSNNEKLLQNLVEKQQESLELRLQLLSASSKAQEDRLLAAAKSRLSLKLLSMALQHKEK